MYFFILLSIIYSFNYKIHYLIIHFIITSYLNAFLQYTFIEIIKLNVNTYCLIYIFSFMNQLHFTHLLKFGVKKKCNFLLL